MCLFWRWGACYDVKISFTIVFLSNTEFAKSSFRQSLEKWLLNTVVGQPIPLHITSVLYNSQMKNYNDRAGNREICLLWTVRIALYLLYLYMPRTCVDYVSLIRHKEPAVLVITEQPRRHSRMFLCLVEDQKTILNVHSNFLSEQEWIMQAGISGAIPMQE